MNRLTKINNENSAMTTLVENDFTYPPTSPLPPNPDFIQAETVTGADVNFTGGNVAYTNNNNNQLTNVAGLGAYAYDADGNMTTGYTPDGRPFTATYDYENRLASISCTDASNVSHSASFTYDANGYIAKQVLDGVESRFVRDGYTLLQERNGSNSVTRAFLWNPLASGGIGGLLEMKTGGAFYDYLYDGKGNVSAVTDDSQNIAAKYVYNLFGSLISQSGTLNQPYMFSTKPYLKNFGLYYYGSRFYSPLTSRWISMDPIREKGGFNYYQFAGNNATNIADAYGLCVINLFAPNSVEYNLAANMPSKGMIIIAGHGSSNSIHDERESKIKRLGVDDIVKLIKQAITDGNASSDDFIILGSCRTGEGGTNSIAQKLADELNEPVSAPDKDLLYMDSNSSINPFGWWDIEEGGKFELFNKNESPIECGNAFSWSESDWSKSDWGWQPK